VQSTSRSTLKYFAASGAFQPAGLAKPLRLAFDTAALRGQCRMRSAVVLFLINSCNAKKIRTKCRAKTFYHVGIQK
jgi:hypothetical protein